MPETRGCKAAGSAQQLRQHLHEAAARQDLVNPGNPCGLNGLRVHVRYEPDDLAARFTLPRDGRVERARLVQIDNEAATRGARELRRFAQHLDGRLDRLRGCADLRSEEEVANEDERGW